MATGGVLGNGTKVAYSASSPVSWTKVGQLKNIDQFMSLVASRVDTTVYSTSNLKTSMPGMVDAPEMQFTVLLDLDETTTPSHDALMTYQDLGTTLWWRVEVPVTRAQGKWKSFEFQAYVSDVSPDLPIDDAQTAQITIVYGGSWSKYPAGNSSIS